MISIYRLYVEGEELCYVGSTALTIEERLRGHRKKAKLPNPKCTSHVLFYLGDVKTELLETCTEENRNERERYWIENTPNTINHTIPGRSKKETAPAWEESNREKRNAQHRALRQANLEHYREYDRLRHLHKKLLQQE